MKITARVLKYFNACDSAMQLLRNLLPAMIYKKAEMNNSLAGKLINVYTFETDDDGFYRSLVRDLDWLLYRTSTDSLYGERQCDNMWILKGLPSGGIFSRNNCELDPLVISQVLVWIADTDYKVCSV